MALGAAYFAAIPVIRLFETAPLYRAVEEGRLDVSLLRKLRAGNTKGPIESLEFLLDGNIITLGDYAVNGDPQFRTSAKSALAKLAVYRQDFPTIQTDPQVLKMLDDALSHANKPSSQVP
jgi:hypothetical protein